MKLRHLYIKKYKKFYNTHIFFDKGKENFIQKDIFGSMNITTLIGENGSGKTTIMSFISTIFRYLQRNQFKIPCDFVLEYEISNNIVILTKEDNNIFFTLNGNQKKLLLEYNIKKGYIRKPEQDFTFEDIRYDQVKQYLPNEIIISCYDIDYPDGYNWNYKGDRLLIISSGNSYHTASSTGLKISLGILRFLKRYHVEDDDFKKYINALGLKFSNMICAYCTVQYKSEEVRGAVQEILYSYGVNDEYRILNEIITGKYFEKFFVENKHHPSESIYQNFDLQKYLKYREYNGSLLEVLIQNGAFYINDYYMKKDDLEYSMSYMSTGEKILLGKIFFILSNISKNSVVIVEEPEIHLNYSWVKQIISLFIILFKNSKAHFIISSHSYHLINTLLPEQILILENNIITFPEFQTLLCSDEELSYKVFKRGLTKNYIEYYIQNLLEENDGKKLEMIFHNLGESYDKLKVFKRLLELGEINVENQ